MYVVIGVFAADKFPLDVWEARLLESNTAPKLYEMLHELCERADVDFPSVFSSPRLEPNAFAVFRRDGGPAIIINNGLTRYLERDEVQAVMALMIARLATGAMPAWTITATLAGLPLHLGLLCCRRRGWEWLGAILLSVFAYPSAALARLGWSAGVITASDYHAVHLAEHPGAFDTALVKMQKRTGQELAGAATRRPPCSSPFRRSRTRPPVPRFGGRRWAVFRTENRTLLPGFPACRQARRIQSRTRHRRLRANIDTAAHRRCNRLAL